MYPFLIKLTATIPAQALCISHRDWSTPTTLSHLHAAPRPHSDWFSAQTPKWSFQNTHPMLPSCLKAFRSFPLSKTDQMLRPNAAWSASSSLLGVALPSALGSSRVTVRLLKQTHYSLLGGVFFPELLSLSLYLILAHPSDLNSVPPKSPRGSSAYNHVP